MFHLTQKSLEKENPAITWSPNLDTNSSNQPLAARVRPRTLDEFVGQRHLLGEGKPLRVLAWSGSVHSMILWGPPGTGKTTLARILAENARSNWIPMSAVAAGVKDVRSAIRQAETIPNVKTVVFLDEVHRFNRAQQDALLPYVENGTITLVGATTENPSFEVNSALLSRTRVFVLKPLADHEVERIVKRAISLELSDLVVSDESLKLLCSYADGDARRSLNLLELAAQLSSSSRLDPSHVEEAMGQSMRKFDKQGDEFYNQISALHKSLRGSHPDAALYWFVRMLDGGCDPLYIARRLVRFASEDIGTADNRSLTIALDAWDAYHRLGSPEGELCLAQAVLYLAAVPKSNAVYSALGYAKRFVQENPSWPVPLRLRNAPTKLMEGLDYGKSYRYTHNEDSAYAAGEHYFPDEISDQRFYKPSERGMEQRIKERLEQLRQLDKEHREK
ncbi:MAG: replication-associated recombination protein A [Gammaproteobacteria bacterium]|nr:replication-associated recombination protein A [Gammaproteobacteria bacterium]